MNNKLLATSVVMILCAGILLSGCIHLNTAMGPGSETVAIYGKIVDSTGLGAPKTLVMALPTDFNRLENGSVPQNQTDTTDDNGNYRISAPHAGSYSIQALSLTNQTRLLVQLLQVKTDSVTAPVGTLAHPGAIRVMLPDSLDIINGYLYIPGTTLFTWLADANGSVVLDSVPAGAIPAIVYKVFGTATKKTLCTNITVSSNATITLWPAWRFAKQLVLNTTATGADISGTVTGFPALVRLNSANFPFGQAEMNGRDLRFTKPDGTPLSYEIEQWDAANRTAAIWVKVDTIYGNNGTQSITMYWGAPVGAAVNATSNGAAVFDTSAGYAAVLHLDASCRDATLHGRNGINYNASDTRGIAGTAKKFDGTDSIKIASLCGKPGCLTLSAWAALDSTITGNGSTGSEVVSLGNAALLRMDDSSSQDPAGVVGSFAEDTIPTFVTFSSGIQLKKSGWHFLVYSIDTITHTHSVYIDGNLVKTGSDPNPINYSRASTFTCIGIHANRTLPIQNNYNFFGTIDEVRIYNKAVTADYVKACYMNQRIDDKMVVFGP